MLSNLAHKPHPYCLFHLPECECIQKTSTPRNTLLIHRPNILEDYLADVFIAKPRVIASDFTLKSWLSTAMLLLSSSELPIPYHGVIPASMGPISLTSLTSLLPSSLHYTTLPISSKTSPQRPCKQSRLVTTPSSTVFSSLAARSQSVFLSWQAEARNLEMILLLLLKSTVVGCRILLAVNGACGHTFGLYESCGRLLSYHGQSVSQSVSLKDHGMWLELKLTTLMLIRKVMKSSDLSLYPCFRSSYIQRE